MAGYRVAYALEFIPEAQRTYKANHPDSYLDTVDIRDLKPEQLLKRAGVARGELDILDGSPPCSAFSTAGSREKGWGKVKDYSDGSQRVDDLFYEYARILEGVQPKVFVAENVTGLVKGTAKGYFKRILQELKHCGYNVSCKVLDARWLGVPQARQRTIFVGTRQDLNLPPVHPSPFAYTYTIEEAIKGCTAPTENEITTDKSIPLIMVIALSELIYLPISASVSVSDSSILKIDITTEAPKSVKTIETVVEVGNPRVLKKSSSKISVMITAIKMIMISSK